MPGSRQLGYIMEGAVKLHHWEPGGYLWIGWVIRIRIWWKTQVEVVGYKLIKDRLGMIGTGTIQGQILKV